MLVQDPMTGEIYDDGSGDFGSQPDYGYNQTSLFNFMQPDAFQQPSFAAPAYSTTKSMFGRQLPMGQPQLNQQYTGAKNFNQLLTNPSVLYNTEVATGATTMDPNALQGLDQYGMPLGSNQFLPGGGGGGGGGDLGYKPVFTTPTLDRIAGSDDEISKLIMLGINNNQSPGKIKSDIRNSPMGKKLTDAELNDYSYDVDSAMKEFSDKARNDQLGQFASQQPQQPQQSAIQQFMAKAGLQNPLQQYDETNLPGDIDLSAIDAANMKGVQQGTQYDQKIAALQRQAEMLNNQARDYANPTNAWRAFSDPIGLAHTMGQDYVPQNAGAPVSMNKGGIVDSNFGISLPQRGQVDPTIMTGPGFTTTVQQGDSERRQEELRKRGTPAKRVDPRIQQQQQRVNTQIQLQRNLKGAQDRGTQEYGDAVRRMAVQGLQAQGRTPARDAQRAVLNYLRSGGLAV